MVCSDTRTGVVRATSGSKDHVLLHPENYADSTALQTSNSIMAIGSGGLFGKGFGSNTISNVSASDVNLVSENQTDFIFSVIGEEFGFVGCVVLIIVLHALYISA